MAADSLSALVLIALTAWELTLRLGPYVLGGIALAALLGQIGLPRRWQAYLCNGGTARVLGAACLGSLSPAATSGTVPLLISLLQRGAPPGPVLAFLSASSLLNPTLLLMVAGGLGVRTALLQFLGVLLLALTVGLLASRLDPTLFLRQATCAASRPITPSATFSWRGLARDVLRLGEWIGFTFTIGILVTAVIQVCVPHHWIAGTLGQGWGGTVLAALSGIPFYHCGGSAVPLLVVLSQAGMGRPALLAFLLAGPATRFTALAAMGTLLNRRALLAYIAYIVIGAVVIGTVLG